MASPLLIRGALATLTAVVANVLVMLAARAVLDIPEEFMQLTAPNVIGLTVIGGALATGAYAIVAKRSERPRRTYIRVALIALLVSFLPDLALAYSDMPGVTWTGVAVLMVLHVVAAAILVPVLVGTPRAPTA